jgi:hypothetical protein
MFAAAASFAGGESGKMGRMRRIKEGATHSSNKIDKTRRKNERPVAVLL